MKDAWDSTRGPDPLGPPDVELFGGPEQLIAYVQNQRAKGNFRGAASVLRHALKSGAGNSEMRILLARTQLDLRLQEEREAWAALVAETRAAVEQHLDNGQIDEAQAELYRLESEHGRVESLADLKVRLQQQRHDHERARLAIHLSDAQRLREEGSLEAAVWQARQALGLDPDHPEARSLAEALILEIESRDLATAMRRDATRIADYLGRGRLWLALLSIRNTQRKFGNLPALQAQAQRWQRLRKTRWARYRVQIARIVGAPTRWIGLRLEERAHARNRALVSRVRQERGAREALIADTSATVDAHVRRGELAEADQVLQSVASEHGTIAPLEHLRERLEALQRERDEAEIACRLSEAARLRSEGELEASLREARRALVLDSRHADAASLVEALSRDLEAREQAAAARQDATAIDGLLAAGHLLRADLKIKQSLHRHGSLPVFRDQLQRCRRRRATRWIAPWARVQKWFLAMPIDRIRAFPGVAAKSTAGALSRGWTSTQHAAGAPARWVRQWAAERTREKRRLWISQLRQQRRARRALVSEKSAVVEEYVERGELGVAQAILAEVINEHGTVEELAGLEAQVARLRLDQESAELAGCLQEAEHLYGEGRLQDSLAQLRRALELEPQHPETLSLTEALSQELEAQRLTAAVGEDADRIGELLRQGHLLQAELAIRLGERKHGTQPEYPGLLRRCRRLRKVRWGRGWSRGQSVLATRFRVLAQGLQGGFLDPLWDRLKGWKQARTPALAASVGLVVLATAGMYLLVDRYQADSEISVEALVSEVEQGVEPQVSPAGDLILDALPWGRVVAIVGKQGEPEVLEDGVFTPVRRSLPAGTYRVVMEHPSVDSPVEFSVEVLPSSVTTRVYEFEPVDVDAYFSKAGW